MRSEPLANLDREITVRFRSINACLIVRHGQIVFERYYNGFGPDDTHLVASVTKSFTSALIGIAIEQGSIGGVDQNVLGYFPEYTPGPHEQLKQKLTVKHLLTMTAGFHWPRGPRGNEQLVDRMRRSKDWVAFILGLPVHERLIGKFQYNTAASHLLSAIITRSTGQCARDYAARYLLEPIGIEPPPAVEHTFRRAEVFRNRAGWPRDPQGNSTGGWGLDLKPRDMARFGYLYLNRGHWDGKQIIPTQWVEDSTKRHTPGYGYQWWLGEVNSVFVFSADGMGGSHIICVPEKELVVVIASKIDGRWRDRWPLIKDFVLPAVVR
jgi:CubicO group peptidase (beta-lactamase class C family)